MTYEEFLNEVIERGIHGVLFDFGKPEDKPKLEGSLEGFRACRGKKANEIADLLALAREASSRAFMEVSEKKISSEEYWKLQYIAAQVEWVANVLSAVLPNYGIEPIVEPTVRGAMAADAIIKEAKA